eukprot:TRINITY_DN27517_c0_g1_i1.p1 TRINITY_DN27517_c0_g1~~TRINITY_DN27517_c0_g1_i1.p1  ORF type:complete len:1198 (-),score=144.89 TRINITY_DN27517_c0_g1_i1:42-3635(-)
MTQGGANASTVSVPLLLARVGGATEGTVDALTTSCVVAARPLAADSILYDAVEPTDVGMLHTVQTSTPSSGLDGYPSRICTDHAQPSSTSVGQDHAVLEPAKTALYFGSPLLSPACPPLATPCSTRRRPSLSVMQSDLNSFRASSVDSTTPTRSEEEFLAAGSSAMPRASGSRRPSLGDDRVSPSSGFNPPERRDGELFRVPMGKRRYSDPSNAVPPICTPTQALRRLTLGSLFQLDGTCSANIPRRSSRLPSFRKIPRKGSKSLSVDFSQTVPGGTVQCDVSSRGTVCSSTPESPVRRSESGSPTRPNFTWKLPSSWNSSGVGPSFSEQADVASRLGCNKLERTATRSELRELTVAVRKNWFCAGMNQDEIDELTWKPEILAFVPGDEVVKQGEVSTHFFVVKEGKFRLCTKSRTGGDREVVHLTAGDSFGEVALLHQCRQWATVTAETAGECWIIDGSPRGEFARAGLLLLKRNYADISCLFDQVRMSHYIDPRERKQLCKTVTVQVFGPGSRVIREGLADDNSTMYLVKSGKFAVKLGEIQVATLERGDLFGERSFLYKMPRSATVLAVERSEVVNISITTLEKVLGKSFQHVMWQNVVASALGNYLRARGESRDLPFLNKSEAEILTIADQFLIQDLPAKTSLREIYAHGLRFLIVLDGSILVRGRGDAEGRLVLRGESFGQEYMNDVSLPFHHSVESGDVPCKLAVLSSDALMSWTSFSSRTDNLNHKQKIAMVRKVYVFRHLSDHHCNLIAKSFRMVVRARGENVIQEGDIGSEFYVIKSGELVVTLRGRTLRTLGVADYFGERGLLYNEPRTATVTCQSEQAELMVINKAVFMEIIEDKLVQNLEERIRMQQTDVQFDDLRVLKVVGRGTYGVVKLVEHNTNKHRYALKCISREEAEGHNQQENLRLEREILLENDHPFIVKVVRTFKDRHYLYFLTELVSGGELYDAIREIGNLSKAQVQFYCGSLVLALESLHQRSIAYRDLKPENVMLDCHGYTKLIDFGCAVKLRSGTQGSRTIIGTPNYMAPEVILGQGYGLSCDVWSFGVCLYELACGPMPFGHDVDNVRQVFREVLTARLTFPSYVQDATTVSVVRRLLSRSIETRLGCGPSGLRSIKKHCYFADFSFDRLLSRKLEPPLLPRTSPIIESLEETSEDVPCPSTASSSSAFGSNSDNDEADQSAETADAWDKDF